LTKLLFIKMHYRLSFES